MTYVYLVHGTSIKGGISAVYHLKKPITHKDLEWIAKNLSEGMGDKVIVVSFSPFPPTPLDNSDSEETCRVFLVRNVTNGQVLEFSLRSEAEEYHTMMVSSHGELFEYEFVARIKHHVPSEILS